MAATEPPRLAPTPGGLTDQALRLALANDCSDRTRSAFDEIANRLLVLEAAQLFENFNDLDNLNLGFDALMFLFNRVRELKDILKDGIRSDNEELKRNREMAS